MSKFTSETVLNATKKGKPGKALEDAPGKRVHSQLNTKLSAQWGTDPEKVTLKPHAVTVMAVIFENLFTVTTLTISLTLFFTHFSHS